MIRIKPHKPVPITVESVTVYKWTMILDYVAMPHLMTHLVAKTLISPFTTLGRVVIVVVLVPVVVVLVVEARNTSVPVAIPIAILKG